VNATGINDKETWLTTKFGKKLSRLYPFLSKKDETE
jgi:hypothetical protein